MLTRLNPCWSFYHLRKKTQSIKTVSDEAVEKLGMLFSEQLLLAALDLIDRDCGMRRHLLFLSFPLFYLPYKKKQALPVMCDFPTVINYVSPWGRSHFSVLGMTGSYTVFPSLHPSCSIPFFCNCPAFSYAVLISHSQITVCVLRPRMYFIFCMTGGVIRSANTSWPLKSLYGCRNASCAR